MMRLDDAAVELNGAAPEMADAPVNAVAKVKRKKAKPKAVKKASPKAKKAPGKRPAAKKAKSPKKAPKRAAKAGAHKRGPKGWSPKERVRNGVDADIDFGKRVAKARKGKEWPQHELARRVGITQPAMCNIEKATSGAGPIVAAKLAKVLGIKGLAEHAKRRPPSKKDTSKKGKVK